MERHWDWGVETIVLRDHRPAGEQHDLLRFRSRTEAVDFVARAILHREAEQELLAALYPKYVHLFMQGEATRIRALGDMLFDHQLFIEVLRRDQPYSPPTGADGQNGQGAGTGAAAPGGAGKAAAPPPPPPPPTVPCDLDDLQITESQAGVQLQNADPPPTRTLLAIAKGGTYKDHKKGLGTFDDTVFEMVAGARKERSRAELTWEVKSGIGYCSAQHHPGVRISGQDNQSLQAVTTQKFPVYCNERPFDSYWQMASIGPVSDVPFDWITPFWFTAKDPKHITIAAQTCGYRPSDPTHRVTTADILVHVYPRDTYSLNLQLPTYQTVTAGKKFDMYDGKDKAGNRQFGGGLLGKREWSSESGSTTSTPFGDTSGTKTGSFSATGSNGGVASGTSTTTITGSDRLTGRSTMNVQSDRQVNDQGNERKESVTIKQVGTDMRYDFAGGRQGTFGFATYGAPPGVTIELKRNSETPATISFGKIKAQVESARKILKNLNQWFGSPPASFGFSIKGEIKCWTGSVGLTWGYKEMSSNLVTKYYQVSVDLTVVDATVTFFVGLAIESWPVLKLWEVEGIKIGGEASLNGKLVLKHSVTHQEEDEDTTLSIGPQGTITLTGKLTASGGGERWVKVEGSITGGLKVEGKMEISTTKPFKLGARGDMLQTVANAAFFFRGRPRYMEPRELIAPKAIFKWDLPAAQATAH